MKTFRQIFEEVQKYKQGDSYTRKLEILDELESSGVPKDMQGAFCVLKGNFLVQAHEPEKALAYLQKALLQGESMDIFQQRCAFSSYVMAMHYVSGISNEELRNTHLLYGQLFPKVIPFSHGQRKKKKIRVGYLASNLCGGVVAYFVVPFFFEYDRERYEIFFYDIGRKKKNNMSEWVSEKFSGFVDAWYELSDLTIEETAHKIYTDRIDILFDLAGHTEGGITLQICAYKPAPIQICGIGYFDTTGLPAMDYFLGDVFCDAPEMDAMFSERILRLPHSHLCYHALNNCPETSGEYRAQSPVVFGSFNNFSKITDEMLGLWRRLLERVPDSRLFLKDISAETKLLESMRCRAVQLGIPSERLEVCPSSGDYMREYLDVDIALDTYPYPGGGTTCDALYMGVPVISLYGNRHGSRFGYSILSNIGVGELAARSPEEYVEKAVSLALDSELLTLLHHNLRDMMQRSPVMDGKLYIRDIENIYEGVWEKWQASAH